MDERVINLAEKLFVEGFKEQLKKEVTSASTVAGVCLSYAKAFYAEADKRRDISESKTLKKPSIILYFENTSFGFKDFMNTDAHKNYISKNKPQADEVTAKAIIDGVVYEYKGNQYPHWMNVKYATKAGAVIGCSSKNVEFIESLGEYVCMDKDAVFVTLFNEMYEGPVKGSLVYTDLPF